MFSCARRKLSTILKCASYESPEFREEVVSLLKGYLSGPWNNATSKNILIEKLRGGLSNTILQISLPPAIQNEVKDEPKSVILRLHQPLDESSVNQHMCDSLSFICLSERKFGPKLFGIFPGGRIEEYVDARPLTTAELGQTKFSLAIAENLAMIHFMHIPLMKKKGIMFDLMNDWLLQFSKESESWKIECSKTKEYLKQFQNADLADELCWLRNFLGKQNSPVVLCHNDLQEGNILVKSCSVSEEKPKLLFIDYEYCFYNYRGFEFANHFLEYTMNYNVERYPNFVINEKMYPSVESQLKFFRHYLRVIKELKRRAKGSNGLALYSSLDINGSDEAEEEEEEKLLMETSNFRLASHLFWAIWAALRSQSPIDFGYWEYSIARLKAYYRTKEEVTRL